MSAAAKCPCCGAPPPSGYGRTTWYKWQDRDGNALAVPFVFIRYRPLRSAG